MAEPVLRKPGHSKITKDWSEYGKRERQRNGWDNRVQCIRCAHCYRLRAHPRGNSRHCGCGGLDFIPSFPHPDEEQIAIKLYARELEENGTYSNLAREILDEGRAKFPLEGDLPTRVRLYSQ